MAEKSSKEPHELTQQDRVNNAFALYEKLHGEKANMVIMDHGFYEICFQQGDIKLPHECWVHVVPRMGRTEFRVYSVKKTHEWIKEFNDEN